MQYLICYTPVLIAIELGGGTTGITTSVGLGPYSLLYFSDLLVRQVSYYQGVLKFAFKLKISFFFRRRIIRRLD